MLKKLKELCKVTVKERVYKKEYYLRLQKQFSTVLHKIVE